jgi:hypothetical protein
LSWLVLCCFFFVFLHCIDGIQIWDEGMNARNKDLVCLSGRLLLFFPLHCRPLNFLSLFCRTSGDFCILRLSFMCFLEV